MLKEDIAGLIEEVSEFEVSARDIEVPDDKEHGDYASTVAMENADGGNQRELAESITEKISSKSIDFIEKVEVAGPGFINFFLDRKELGERILEDTKNIDFDERDEKVVVEHTSPNPNKPLHMGTLRVSIIGDSIARISEGLGYDVEVQNYINDLGRQTARTIYAYKNFLEDLDEEEKGKKDDFWIGLLYAKAGQYLEEDDSEGEDKVQKIIQDIEEGGNENYDLMKKLVSKSVHGQLETAYRSNIFYDLIAFERHILNSNLLDEAMEELKDLDRVYEIEDGEDEGCVVIDLSDYEDELGGLKKPYKILFRSDGTATYTAKDIAFTMWKFGILDSNFGYEEFDEQPNGGTLWSTGGDQSKNFGDADKVINIVGEPQSYVMDVIKYSLDALGYRKESDNFKHVGFKFVYLPGKISYSGRKGNWVGKHGDAVLDRCYELALEEVEERHEDMSEEDMEAVAEKVMLAAVKYFILKHNREKKVHFSFDKALDWRGDSGPYLLYANARAHGILDKVDSTAEFSEYKHDEEYDLLRELERFPKVIQDSFNSMEPAKIANYLKDLSEVFNSFYHKSPVIDADTEQLKKSRLALVDGYTNVMERGFELLGMEPLEEM